MNRIIITAIGIDKPGLVDEISSIINDNNGNIENSKMIKIDNQFAMIIDFYCSNNLDTIKTKLEKIKNLDITYKSTLQSDKKYKSKQYVIKGADNQGIVKKISNFFSYNDINITEINTYIELGAVTGTPLFNMEIIISYNDLHDIGKIESNLKNLCENRNLDIKIL